MLKLGVIEVLNVLPVFYGILSGRVPVDCEIVKGKVTELNRKLNQGSIDCSVISSFEYAQHPELYYILPDLSISADGPVKSIYLFLDKPIEELDQDVIRLTEYSLTSVHLIQYLLEDYKVSFTQDASIQAAGELLIADEAIARFYKNKDPFVYDLSELWKTKTGLPFVFALWVVRKEVVSKSPGPTRDLYQALLESKRVSQGLFEEMAQNKNQGIFPEVSLCADYLKNLHYEFTTPYQKGFQLFMNQMTKLGKLEKPAELRFLPEE